MLTWMFTAQEVTGDAETAETATADSATEDSATADAVEACSENMASALEKGSYGSTCSGGPKWHPCHSVTTIFRRACCCGVACIEMNE